MKKWMMNLTATVFSLMVMASVAIADIQVQDEVLIKSENKVGIVHEFVDAQTVTVRIAPGNVRTVRILNLSKSVTTYAHLSIGDRVHVQGNQGIIEKLFDSGLAQVTFETFQASDLVDVQYFKFIVSIQELQTAQ